MCDTMYLSSLTCPITICAKTRQTGLKVRFVFKAKYTVVWCQNTERDGDSYYLFTLSSYPMQGCPPPTYKEWILISSQAAKYVCKEYVNLYCIYCTVYMNLYCEHMSWGTNMRQQTLNFFVHTVVLYAGAYCNTLYCWTYIYMFYHIRCIHTCKYCNPT